MRAIIERLRRRLRPRHPLVRQYDQVDCGPAALLSVLRHHGGDASLVAVRDLCATDARGSTLLSLLRAAEALGFRARGVTGQYDDLRKEALPAIAHVVVDGRLHHYVVVYRMEAGRVLVGDPGKGLHWTPRAEFEAAWASRAVLLLAPAGPLTREPPQHWLRWIGAYFRREETWLYQSVFLGVVYTALGLLTSVFVQRLIDRLIPQHRTTAVLVTGGMLLGVQAVRAAVGFVRGRFMIELNRRVSVRVNEDFVTHLLHLPARFFETRKTGDITARMADTVKIQQAMLQVFGTSIIDAMVIVGSLLFLFQMAPQLAWVAAAGLPVYTALLLRATRRIKLEQADVMKGYAAAESSYIDTLGGMDEVRGFGAAPWYAGRNVALYTRFAQANERLGRTQVRLSLAAELAGGMGVMGALVWGAFLVIQGDMKLGSMMAAYSLLAGMLPAATRLVLSNVQLQGASVAATRLLDLLLVDTEADPGTRELELGSTLRIRGGGFAWPRGQALFRDVEMELAPGRLTALWGLSGSGKSTLVRLLERKHALTAGELQAGGVPADHFSLASWRRGVASVPETVKIFNGTLAENVLMGRPCADLAALAARVEETGLLPFFSRFEGGLLTLVGEEGRQLSSGERQVVGLLRALYDRPAVLVVDEGINAIDVETAALVFGTLAGYAREHAVLLISHNLRTLLRADRIYLLEDGRVADGGDPRELMETHDRFRHLWNLQELPFQPAAPRGTAPWST